MIDKLMGHWQDTNGGGWSANMLLGIELSWLQDEQRMNREHLCGFKCILTAGGIVFRKQKLMRV